MSKIPRPAPDFDEIALCLSGGGYRAAAFHLGTLTMLYDLGLIEKVKYFSTASGGTIVAMKFVVDKIAGRKFCDFASDFRKFLSDCNVVNEALKRLTTTECPDKTDDISLIRAAAAVYRESLGLDGLTVKQLKDALIAKATFSDLIFNSTEFYSGNGFRFRVKSAGSNLFGNKYVTVIKDIRDQVELADIIAASSCFPGAFEPMRFPQDFVLADRTLAGKPFSGKGQGLTTVALMDGGIFDNQGLDVMMEGAGRKKPEKLPFDFVLVSDTTQWADELLKYELDTRPGGLLILKWVTYGSVLLLFAVLFASLILAALIVRDAASVSTLQTTVTTIAAAFSIIGSMCLLRLIGYGHDRLRGLRVSGFVFPIWEHVKNLRLGDLKTLVMGRLDSAKVMTFNVFMKRIRAQTMDKALGDVYHTSRKNILEGNIAFAEIYGIERSEVQEREVFKKDLELIPTDGMKAVSKKASAVATALWLTRTEVKDLIACGRITTCYALLDLIWKRWSREARDAGIAGTALPAVPTDRLSPFYPDYEILKAAWSDLKTEFP